MTLSTDTVLQALANFNDPYRDDDLVTRGAVKALEVDSGNVLLSIHLGYPAQGIKSELEAQIRQLVMAVDGVESLELNLEWGVLANKTQNNMQSMHKVKNIVAVASGKGGVGKSTTAVNIALALAAEGATVGILDADIYGPSIPKMLGIAEATRPEFIDEKHFYPIMAHGIQSMSMGYMVTDKTPMVWRGPMVSGALQQLLGQCMWHDLDYLIVDMPPGTGDIQLTLSQKVPVTGAVIVTTPQDIATLDAKKGIEMFRKVEIPVLGVVENMAMHQCSQCGHEEHIFGQGGGQRIADEYQSELLGALPLDLTIRQLSDDGRPTVVADVSSDNALKYREIARRLAANLAMRGRNEANPVVQIIATD
ncbi:MAG: iron-sulfur cluster carrier protein ApbC [Pseudomonadales bacterium]|nr:iron-sulfur cluster carrier protein ApbC [Pseudomonadales bacterium]